VPDKEEYFENQLNLGVVHRKAQQSALYPEEQRALGVENDRAGKGNSR
jgi:hypothetical protein